LLEFIEDFSWKIQKHLCNALELDDMHASLRCLKCSSPSSMFHRLRVPLIAIQNFLNYQIHKLFRVYRMSILQSNISVVPIIGYPRWLLLLLFIKPNYAPKCGISCFIMKEFNKSFTYWILSRTVIRSVVCIPPTIIKIFSSIDLILDCQSSMKLPSVETYSSSICYYQPS
jgi:hypothetical protein